MPEYFQQRLAYESAETFQPYTFASSGFAPDAIVINLGTSKCSSSLCVFFLKKEAVHRRLFALPEDAGW